VAPFTNSTSTATPSAVTPEPEADDDEC
jgi:hypothetical protein